MTEARWRSQLIKLLKFIHAVPVENAAGEGTPDVNTVYGWLELKLLDRWPPRGGPVGPKLLRPMQRVWLRTRCAHAGSAWVLVRIGDEVLMLWGAWAAEHLGTTNKEQLLAAAVAHWPARVDIMQLVEHLKRCSVEQRL